MASSAELSARELAAAQSPEDVAAADYDTDLYAHVVYFLDLPGIVAEPLRIDAEALFSHQALAGELQEYSFESCHCI